MSDVGVYRPLSRLVWSHCFHSGSWDTISSTKFIKCELGCPISTVHRDLPVNPKGSAGRSLALEIKKKKRNINITL